MPRLSNYRPTKTHDFRFFDRTIREMFQVGGCDIFIHKYLGPLTNDNNDGNFDATTPAYPESNPLFIEDLLLLENRDRKYDPDIFIMRMVYQESDVDFDLTQFGLFLNGDTKFLTVHYNDMIDIFGRKLMAGDVLEFPNLRDYNPLDAAIVKALPRYYVVQEGAFASEGFSQTWLPHLWRLKCTPMVNAQEYYDILNKPFEPNNIWDNGNFYPAGTVVQDGDVYYRAKTDVPPGADIGDGAYWELITDPATIGDVDSARDRDLQINDAIMTQAMIEVPKSGFDNTQFYILPTTPDNQPASGTNSADYSITAAAIFASIGGRKQISALQYTVALAAPDDYRLTFAVAPAEPARLQMRYLNMRNPSDVQSQIITPSESDVNYFLAHDSATASSIVVTVNGLALKPNIDYSVTAGVLSFRGRPKTSDIIEILYLSVAHPEIMTSQAFVGTGNFSDYSLQSPVSTANDILVFINGLLQTPIVDYTVADTLIQFTLTPAARANIEIRYIANSNGAPITNQWIDTVRSESTYPVNNVTNAVTPRAEGYTLGYMTGDNAAPNGLPVVPGIAFPLNPAVGAYCLRLDYYPNRLFRFNGQAWIKIEEGIRTDMYLKDGDNTQRSSFVNNRYTTPTTDQGNIPSRQSLSQALKPVADNGNQGGFKPANNPPLTQPGKPTFPDNP